MIWHFEWHKKSGKMPGYFLNEYSAQREEAYGPTFARSPGYTARL